MKIVIQKPSGEVVGYEPLIDHLVGENETVLSPGEQITDSAYIGFGKDGLTFDQPGNYRLRAVYAALDGSQVLSEMLDLRVRYPVTAAAEELADLFMGEEQGTLLYLLGSDHESLARGNEAFDLVLDKLGKSDLAQYARLVKGVNAGRTFKTVDRDMANGVVVRSAQPEQSASLLSAVASSGVLDRVSNEMVLTHLAAAQSLAGNPEAATATLGKLSAKRTRSPK